MKEKVRGPIDRAPTRAPTAGHPPEPIKNELMDHGQTDFEE